MGDGEKFKIVSASPDRISINKAHVTSGWLTKTQHTLFIIQIKGLKSDSVIKDTMEMAIYDNSSDSLEMYSIPV